MTTSALLTRVPARYGLQFHDHHSSSPAPFSSTTQFSTMELGGWYSVVEYSLGSWTRNGNRGEVRKKVSGSRWEVESCTWEPVSADGYADSDDSTYCGPDNGEARHILWQPTPQPVIHFLDGPLQDIDHTNCGLPATLATSSPILYTPLGSFFLPFPIRATYPCSRSWSWCPGTRWLLGKEKAGGWTVGLESCTRWSHFQARAETEVWTERINIRYLCFIRLSHNCTYRHSVSPLWQLRQFLVRSMDTKYDCCAASASIRTGKITPPRHLKNHRTPTLRRCITSLESISDHMAVCLPRSRDLGGSISNDIFTSCKGCKPRLSEQITAGIY